MKLTSDKHKGMKPIVTIGVCVRNSASTLRETIESIISQTYPHELMEVIFVDDGSEDETPLIIDAYASKMDIKVKIFRHKWKGLGFSRNVVVKNAGGKYIIWIDGDIILPKDHVKNQVEFMEKNPEVAISGGSYGMLDQSTLSAFLDNVEYVAYRFKSGINMPGTGGATYRVQAIKQVGGFDENIKGSCEDIDAAYRVKLAGWLVVRDKALFYARGKKNWKDYWSHAVWHGYGAHYVKHKFNNIFSLPKMTIIAAFLNSIIYSVIAYGILKKKKVFLLPLYSIFKNAGWWIGFFKAHIDEYGHIFET